MNYYQEFKKFCNANYIGIQNTWRNKITTGTRRKIHISSPPVDARDIVEMTLSERFYSKLPLPITKNYEDTIKAKERLEAVIDKAKELWGNGFVRAEAARGPYNCFNVNIYMDE